MSRDANYASKAQRLLEEVASIRARQEDAIPDGYLSIEQLMTAWSLGRSQTRLNVMLLVKAGKLKEVRLRRYLGNKLVGISYYG